MKEPDLKTKALEVIEVIVSSDCEVLSNTQREAIYRFAHSAQNGHCRNLHEDWVGELNKMHQNLNI